MTLYQQLVDAQLPVESATEDGQVSMSAPLTEEQQQTLSEILLNYFQPTAYAKLLLQRADAQTIRDTYVSTITQLQAIQNATNPTNAQVVAAVQFLALTTERMLKILSLPYRD